MILIGSIKIEKVEHNACKIFLDFLTAQSVVHELKMKFTIYYKTGKTVNLTIL